MFRLFSNKLQEIKIAAIEPVPEIVKNESVPEVELTAAEFERLTTGITDLDLQKECLAYAPSYQKRIMYIKKDTIQPLFLRFPKRKSKLQRKRIWELHHPKIEKLNRRKRKSKPDTIA